MPARESEGSGLAYEAGAIGDDGAAAGAGAFACDDSVASSSRSAASPASWLPLPLLCGGGTVVV